MNHSYWIDFSYDFICYSKVENISEKSIFVALSSSEFIAVARSMSMLKYSISDKLRYLVENTHTFYTYGWSARHMSKKQDVVETNLQNIEEYPTLFIHREHMMDSFSEAKIELPPPKNFLEDKFEKQQRKCVKDECASLNTCLKISSLMNCFIQQIKQIRMQACT